ncbi:MAG: F0F1 ATP synthase subunit B [Planctomycetota bacterium]
MKTTRLLPLALVLLLVSAQGFARDPHGSAPPHAGDQPHATAEAHEAQPDIFAGNLGNSLVTLIIFGLVIYVLGRFAWRPLLHVLNERERTIRTALETARQEREQAQQLLADYRAQLDRAREQASAIVAEGRRDAEVVGRRVQEEARAAAEELLARARREIQLAADSARKQLHDEASELAVDVAGRIIQKELTRADHRQLVEESLRRMRATGGDRLN